MKKKIVVLFLAIQIILSFCYAPFAEETQDTDAVLLNLSQTRIPAISFSAGNPSNYYVTEGAKQNIVSSDGIVALNTNQTVTYKVNAEYEGFYDIYIVSGQTTDQKITLSEGDKTFGSVTLPKSIGANGKASFYVGNKSDNIRAELTKGEHNITLKLNTSGIFFYSIHFEYVPFEATQIVADSSTALSGAQLLSGDGGNYYLLKSENWLEYTFDVEKSGRYLFCINAKSAKGSFINLSADGETIANTEVQKGSYYQQVPVLINLKEGENKVKLFNVASNTYINGLSLTKISADENAEKKFLSAINESISESEVYGAFKTYIKAFGLDIENLSDGIWYKKPLYMHFVNRGYDDVQILLSDLIKYIDSEKRLPSVTLYNGSQKITEFTSGDLKLTVKSDRFKSGSSVLAGLYEFDSEGRKKLVALSGETEMASKSLAAEFKGVNAENPDNMTWEIFCFENKENIIPYDIYDNVYKNIYVSKKGNDLAEGTKEKPFATLSRAKEEIATLSDSMTGDIIVNIEPGIYQLFETEEFNLSHGGKNGYNVIFRGTDKEKPPEFSGGTYLTDWTPYKDGIYYADLDAEEVRNLYVDGVAQKRARSEHGFKYLEDYNDEDDSAYDLDGFYTSSVEMPDFAYPEELETVWQLVWVSHRMPVDDIIEKDGRKVLIPDRKYWKANQGSDNDTTLNAGKIYYLENAMELLDTPGEFYYDKRQKKIFYYPYSEVDLEKSEIVVPITEKLFKVSGTGKANKITNLVFDNIKFTGGAWNYVSDHGLYNIQASWCTEQGTGKMMLPSAQFDIDMAENVKVLNCEFSSLGSNAIAMTNGVSNAVLRGNVFKDISGSALTVGHIDHGDETITEDMEIPRNIKIENNVFRRIATEYIQCPAICMYYGNGVSIKHNDIYGTPYSGMSVGWGWESSSMYSALQRNIDVSFNKIEDVLITLSDGAPIYTLGHLYESKITNNYFAKVRDKAFFGIYLDAGSSYLNIYDNLVLDVYNYHLYVQSGYEASNNKIFRNYSDRIAFKESGKVGVNDEVMASNSISEAIEVDTKNLPAEALAIKNNAGLEEEFYHLLENIDAPSYIAHSATTIPKHEYENGFIIEGEDFVRSYGSGVERILVYTGLVSYNSGQWMEYDLDLETGEYELLINGATPSAVSLKTSVNGGEYQKITSFPATGKYSAYETHLLGIVILTEGENTLRLYNSSGDMHLDYIVLRKIG